MVAPVLITFAVTLLIGVPIAYVVLIAAGVGILGSGFSGVVVAQQTVSGINSFIMLAVPFFIISGDLAAKGKTSQKIVDTINAFIGHIPGGLGIATVVASAFFGAITGSGIATVVAVGALMLPKLLNAWYPKNLALGIIACSGTLGVMIPPSIPMLTMAVALQNSVGEQFIAGFLPGILVVVVMSVFISWKSKKLGIPRTPKMTWRERGRVLKESFWALLFPVIILGSIYGGLATPTEAAVISAVYVIIIEMAVYKELTWKSLYKQLGPSIVNAATMSVLLATAQTLLYFLTSAHVPELMLNATVSAIQSPIAVLLILCGIFLVAGCFMNVGSVVIILASVLLPLFRQYNIDVTHFVIIANLMNMIGFITPPFGLCLFVAMKIGDSNMKEVFSGSWQLLVCIAICTLLVIFIPEISTFLPSLMAR